MLLDNNRQAGPPRWGLSAASRGDMTEPQTPKTKTPTMLRLEGAESSRPCAPDNSSPATFVKGSVVIRPVLGLGVEEGLIDLTNPQIQVAIIGALALIAAAWIKRGGRTKP
jgi:hypothetical protein